MLDDAATCPLSSCEIGMYEGCLRDGADRFDPETSRCQANALVHHSSDVRPRTSNLTLTIDDFDDKYDDPVHDMADNNEESTNVLSLMFSN